MLKLVVFDCDGVMFDSKNLNKYFYNYLLQHYDFQPMSVADLEYVHSHNVIDSVAHIFRNTPEIPLEEIHTFRMSLNYSDFLQYMTMEKDLISFLDSIKGKYDLAISTNRSDTMNTILETFGLTGYFGKVMTSANARKSKPAPDAMFEILDFYKCDSKEAIYIGDTIIDQHHAESSGVDLIAFRNNSLNARYHVNSFTEILGLQPFQQ